MPGGYGGSGCSPPAEGEAAVTMPEPQRSCVEAGISLHAYTRGRIDEGDAVQRKITGEDKIVSSDYSRANKLVGRPIVGMACVRRKRVGPCAVVFKRRDRECGLLPDVELDDVLSEDAQDWFRR